MKTFILLDRSGSMTTNWVETLGAINAYADKVKNDKVKITVAAFDSSGFDIVRDNVKAKDFSPITDMEVQPRGMTPLFDSIGKMAQVVRGKKSAVMILTDGAENSSNEVSKSAAKDIIGGWKSKDYDVTFIGADFDAFGEAVGLGVSAGATLNIKKANLGATMDAYAARTVNYAKGLMKANSSWSDSDRTKLAS